MSKFVETIQPTVVCVDGGSAWIGAKSPNTPCPVIIDYSDIDADETEDTKEEEILINGSTFYIDVEFKTSTCFAMIFISRRDGTCSQEYDLICQCEGEKLVYVSPNCLEHPLPEPILERAYQMVHAF
ncbi:hypothetical protein J2Z48_002988 [Croceifilum oryzae]|uniref:Uncharacterized protein n=1 Tax=Croceifilum oryzae TaxID=1553429 RepID=A0AAJ1THV9_9BACL|nr:hypothetical protein [Croceifilum oryzae]MDQ0418784.1 hypothetical protein [Croceifilum oryzae]